MAKFQEVSVALPKSIGWTSSKEKIATENYNVVFTRFPFESQLGGEELHTIDIAKFYRSQKAKVIFWGSCEVLRNLFQENEFVSRYSNFYKPPVDLFSLIGFTLLSPLLFLKAGFEVFSLKLKYGFQLRIYMLSFTEKLIWSPWCWLFGVKCMWLEHARFGNWFHKNPWQYWYKFWASKSNVKVVTVSKLMQKESGIKNIKVITNAINGSKFKKILDASRLPLEMRRAFARKSFDIGFVGRFSEDKGINLIIEAAAKIPEAGFICVGNGVLKDKLDKNQIDNMLLDHSLIPCFMQNIDLLILPATKVDPFGLVVLEAMHAGTPVLLTDKCGVAYHLSNKTNAFICAPENFIETLQELVKNRKLIDKVKKNLDFALDEFDYEKMKKQYWNVLA